jgi:hypothetical protein
MLLIGTSLLLAMQNQGCAARSVAAWTAGAEVKTNREGRAAIRPYNPKKEKRATDSMWPNSLEVIKKDFAKVPREVTQKIVFDNAIKLYRMA